MPDTNRTIGRLVLPSTTAVASFQELFPGRQILLDLFTAAIVNDLGIPWGSACQGTTLRASGPVEHRAPAQPSEDYIQTTKCKFPALFVYPTENSRSRKFSSARTEKTQEWACEYILGPLEPTEVHRLWDMLIAVQAVASTVIAQGGHVAYSADESGAYPTQVLFEDGADGPGAGFSSITLTNIQTGAAAFSTGGPIYHGTRILFETTEIGSQTGAGTAVPHLGINVEMTGGDDATVEDFIDWRSDIP